MITLEEIRNAIQSPDPYAQMDRLVRMELAAGRLVDELVDAIRPLVDSALDTPGLTEDGEEAFLGTLDALMGNCHRDHCFANPPVLPTEGEIARLPRWARVAFAARCAQRVLQLDKLAWDSASEHGGARGYQELFEWSAEMAARTAADAGPVSNNALIDLTENATRIAAGEPTGILRIVVAAASVAEELSTDISAVIRRDFDHIARLAKWQHWTDDTPVSPEVFGPLWPEGPPAGWSADPDVPQRSDLTLEVLSSSPSLDRVIEDEVVNLFNSINDYYIARTGNRLTLEDLRLLVSRALPVEV